MRQAIDVCSKSQGEGDAKKLTLENMDEYWDFCPAADGRLTRKSTGLTNRPVNRTSRWSADQGYTPGAVRCRGVVDVRRPFLDPRFRDLVMIDCLGLVGASD
jgi:hypothetical protein